MLNALEMNLKALKGKPISADKAQTLTKIGRNMRKQGRGGVLKRVAAPYLAWNALFVSSFDFYPREWGFLSREGFEICFQSI